MLPDRLLTKWALAPLMALALAGAASGALIENGPISNTCGAWGDALASTCNFNTGNVGRTGTPVSAETDFIEDWDTRGFDGLTLATHELFHAIGFAAAYANFSANLYVTPGAGSNPPPAGSRVYSTSPSPANILMTLTPSDEGTHADPNATGAAPWPATGYNQANDIMQPELPLATARTLSATDFAVLNNAFNWGVTGIKIQIVNLGGTLDDTDLNIVANAAAAITAQYGSFGGSPTFEWDVAEVTPEPGTWGLLAGGVIVLAAARRRVVN